MDVSTRRLTKTGLLRLSARVLIGTGNGSIFLFLALPLVSLSTCAGPVVEISGYQALVGVNFPAAEFSLPANQYPGFGPDLWVAGVILIALVGIATALRGGLKAAMVGLGAALLGLIVLQPAIGFFSAPKGNAYWSPEAAAGGVAIFTVFVGSAFIDLARIAWRSWSEVRRKQKPASPDIGDWFALGLASTAFLVLLGLAILGVMLVLLWPTFQRST